MKLKLSTTRVILLGFLLVILLGALLLSLPISSASNSATPFVDALFTATTSTCVTGLVVVPTVSHWSLFGQIVILLLIQIGGLGVITVMAGFLLTIKRKFSLSDSILIQDSFNINTLSGLSSFVKKVLVCTLTVEAIGALCYMTVFVRDFGGVGVWYSIFNSVSAFCNAGLDVIAEDSLIGYATNPIINLTTELLIILGGIGYIVWFDVAETIKRKRGFRYLTLHSKIALSTTFILILSGACLFFIFEYDNPDTIGNMSLGNKMMVSLFQSVTTRTAGFATVNEEAITNPSAVVTLFLMFIGGSPVSTAGGIKTVTLTALIAGAMASIKGNNETTVFSRTIPAETLRRALAIFTLSISVVIASTLLLSTVTSSSFLNILFESVSATATVGLSRNLTPLLNTAGKIIITLTMYLGRIGPISLAFMFKTKKDIPSRVKNPIEKISVG